MPTIIISHGEETQMFEVSQEKFDIVRELLK